MEKLDYILPDQFRDTASLADLRAEYKKQFLEDPSLLGPRLLWYLVNFSRRAHVVEKGTIQLLTGIMTISGDDRLVEKIATTESFPAEYEAEYICQVVGELRKRLVALQAWKDAHSNKPKEDPEKEAARESARRSTRIRIRKEVRTIFDTIMDRVMEQVEGIETRPLKLQPRPIPLLEDECLELPDGDDEKHKDDDPVCTMYQELTGQDVKHSIIDEVHLMKKHFKKIRADHQNIRATFASLKGQVSWNLLCKCFEEVDRMKDVIEKMTGGEVEFIEPKKILSIAGKLNFVEDKLYDMDDNLHEIPKANMRKMVEKACPILEIIGIAETIVNNDEENLRNAQNISERAQDMRFVIEYCSELIAEQITQMAGRLRNLIETEIKIEGIIQIKADKEYLFHVIDEKADKVLVNNLVSECFLHKKYQEICRQLCDYLVMLMKKMMMWIDALKEYQTEVQCTVEEDEFENIQNKLLKRLQYLRKQVIDLEDGYKNYKINNEKFEMQPFKDLTCFVDEIPAVMYNNPDATVPVLGFCPMKMSIAPETAWNLTSFRREYYEDKRLKPCTRLTCPRDYEDQIVCPVCLGQSREPCKHKKHLPNISYLNLQYMTEWSDSDDDSSEDSEDDEEKHLEARKKPEREKSGKSQKIASETTSSKIVREILKDIF